MFLDSRTSLAWLAPLTTPAQAPRGAPTDARSRAQQVLTGLLAAGHVPGVSAGISDAHVVGTPMELALAAGKRDPDESAPLEVRDLLCAGSTGKTLVAAVVLQLVSEEKLTLDALAGEYLGAEEWFERLPNAGELNVANLLGHRSGLPRYEFQPESARDLLTQPERVWKPAELLGYVLDHMPECVTNEGFAYADTNYIVLGMIVERVSGASLYAEVERRLQAHDPLGFPERVLDRDGRFAAATPGAAAPRRSSSHEEGEAACRAWHGGGVAGEGSPPLPTRAQRGCSSSALGCGLRPR